MAQISKSAFTCTSASRQLGKRILSAILKQTHCADWWKAHIFPKNLWELFCVRQSSHKQKAEEFFAMLAAAHGGFGAAEGLGERVQNKGH